MGENGCPVEYDLMWNSVARGGICLKKNRDPKLNLVIMDFFQEPAIFFDVW